MSRPRARSSLTLVALALASLALAACGSDSDSETTAAPTTVAAAATTVAAVATTAAPAAGGAVTVELADTALGKVIVDGAGMALYLFTKDTDGTSVCSGECITNWPPFVSDGVPTVGDGLEAEDFGTITGTDGSTQVTFYGHPLYYFAGDTKAGDTNGQKVGGVWFLVDAEGNAIQT